MEYSNKKNITDVKDVQNPDIMHRHQTIIAEMLRTSVTLKQLDIENSIVTQNSA